MQKIAMRLRDLLEDAELIVSSPYVRARQTAEIMSQIFFETKVVETAELVPHAPPQAFVRWLKAHSKDLQNLIVVGHEPQLSVLASYLIAGSESSILEMKKSGIACLEIPDVHEAGPACAELKWLLPPRIWES